jgi:hypothetical protein
MSTDTDRSYDLMRLETTIVLLTPDHRHLSFAGGIDRETPSRQITQVGCLWVDQYMAAMRLDRTPDSLIETLDKARAWRERT